MSPDGNKLRMKEWATDDRPREKMLLKGVFSLSDAELLAILIGSGNNDETAVQLAQRILNSVSGNLNELGKLSIKELMRFKGIGDAKAVTVAAAIELGRRKNAAAPMQRPTVQSSRQVFDLFHPLLCDLPHEELWVALTNRSAAVIEKIKISQGGVGQTAVDLRLILKAAIQSLASGIIVCHNHPSGNNSPSSHDDALTTQLKQAAELIDIRLLDHLIICNNTYYSYADAGRLG